MAKKASLKGKGHSILLGEENIAEPLPTPRSELEGDMEAERDTALEESGPEAEEAVDWTAMMEDEIANAEPPEKGTDGPSLGSQLPSIEYYYPEESPSDPEPAPPAFKDPIAAEPSPASITPVGPATPVISEFDIPPRSGNGGAPSGDIDWSAMMEDEVTTAESTEGTTVPPIEYYYPPEEPALPESELVEAQEPAPAMPVVSPVDTLEPSGPPVSESADQQPSPAPVPEIRLGGLLAGIDLTGTAAPPGPGFKEVKVRETTKPPPKELSDEEEEIVMRRVTRKQRRNLFDLISQLYKEVPRKLSAAGLKARREEALLLLSEARDIVLENPRQFDEAEHKVWQVEAIIANAADVVKWSHHYGNRLIAYLSTWFVFFMGCIIFFNPIAAWFESIMSSVTLVGMLPINVVPLLFSMLWGGIGGIIGGFYSLWRHIAEEQDFDKQYTVWYTLQPIAGLGVGGIIHLVTLAGFLSMFVQVSDNAAAVAQNNQSVLWFPALLAVVAGFRPNFVYSLLGQIIELVGHRADDK